MQKPKFDFRQLRDDQIQRLRDRAGRLANIRELGNQAHRIRQLQLRGEYLIPIVAFLILASAIFLSRVVPSTDEVVDATPADQVATPADQVAIMPTPAVDEGAYPGPSATSDPLGDDRTPVPTTADLQASPDITDTLPLYPGPQDLDLPLPIGTPSGTDELPTPAAGGLNPGSDLFPTPDFNDSDEYPPSDDTNGGDTFPPVDNTDGSYPAPEAINPDASGGSTDPDPGSPPPPPVFPTIRPPVAPAQSAPTTRPRVVPAQPAPVAPALPAPVVRTPVRQNPPAGITTVPARTPTPVPAEEPIGTGPDTGYPVPEDPDLVQDPEPGENPGSSPPPPVPTARQPGGGPASARPTPTTRPIAATPRPIVATPRPIAATPDLPEAPTVSEEPTPEQPTTPPTATLPPPPTTTPAPPPTPTLDPIIRIEGNTSWTAAQSPILIDRDHVLVTGASLQIDPGVEVHFKPGTNIIVEGQLRSTGNAAAPVRFIGPEGRWGALVGQPGSSITLAHTDLRNAGRGGVALSSTGGALVLQNVRLTDSGGGILASGAAVDIRGTQITGNDLQSGPAVNIALGSQAPVALHGNIVGGNQVPSGTPQVRLMIGAGGSGPIDIQGNGFTGGSGPLVDLQTASALGGTIRCNGFRGGSVGLQLSSSTSSGAGFNLAIDTNAFEAQSVAGAASTVDINAAGNWWGDPSGPADAERNPQGQGVRIGVKVGFSPVLQARPECAPVP